MKRLFLFVDSCRCWRIYGYRAGTGGPSSTRPPLLRKLEQAGGSTARLRRTGRAGQFRGSSLGNAYLRMPGRACGYRTVSWDWINMTDAGSFSRSLRKEPRTISRNRAMCKWSYPYFDLYLENGAVYFWNIKKVDRRQCAGEKAAAAYKKAYELDTEGWRRQRLPRDLGKVADAYKQDADEPVCRAA